MATHTVRSGSDPVDQKLYTKRFYQNVRVETRAFSTKQKTLDQTVRNQKLIAIHC